MGLDPRAAASYLYQAGFRGDALVTALAIAFGESRLNPGARGDVSLQTSKWGPSIGLMQIRSLNSQLGSGDWRDGSRLSDPMFNAQAAFAISGAGRSFSPWSVYKSGRYQSFLAQARAAVGAMGQVGAGAALGAGFGTRGGTGPTGLPGMTTAPSQPSGGFDFFGSSGSDPWMGLRAGGFSFPYGSAQTPSAAEAQNLPTFNVALGGRGGPSSGSPSSWNSGTIPYHRAVGCSGGPTEGIQALEAHWTSSTGLRSGGTYNCRRVRTRSGSGASWSLHAEGRAVDLMANAHDPRQRSVGWSYANWLVANAGALQVQQINWNGMVWNPKEGWRPVSRNTIRHDDHLHVELNRNGANQRHPLFSR